jgi:peptide/nickel transport system substrate-binding protein
MKQTILAVLLAVVGINAAAMAADDRPLRVVAPFEILGLEPAQAGHIFLRMDVAETLVTYADGVAKPALAESWALSDDKLTWRFTIHDGATFHDGTKVTAQAVGRGA